MRFLKYCRFYKIDGMREEIRNLKNGNHYRKIKLSHSICSHTGNAIFLSASLSRNRISVIISSSDANRCLFGENVWKKTSTYTPKENNSNRLVYFSLEYNPSHQNVFHDFIFLFKHEPKEIMSYYETLI